MKRFAFVISVLFLTVGCDQVTKVVARDTLKNFRTIHLFSNSLTFQYTENPGAFLSLGAGLPESWRFGIFTLSVSLFLAFTLFILFQKNNMDRLTTAALALLTGGGIGNLIDRIFRGKVSDFIHLSVGPLQTGVFNVADVAIVLGVVLYLFVHFRKSENQTI